MDTKLIIVLLSVVCVTYGTDQNPTQFILQDSLLSCGFSNQLPTLHLQFQPSNPQVVRTPPAIPTTRDSFGLVNFPNGQLEVLHRSTPGDIDRDRQLINPPSITDVLPQPLVSRSASIDDILPTNSPFFTDSDDANTTAAIRDFVLSSGIGQCSVVIEEWTDLGEYYFPRYYAGAKCEQKDCSVPSGQSCQPNFNAEPTFLNVLHWDCCYVLNFNLQFPWQYTCGWKKARLPVLSFCECSCSAGII